MRIVKVIFAIVLMSLVSCFNNGDDSIQKQKSDKFLEGDYGPDNIGLSKNKAQFKVEGDSILISSIGSDWWINSITFSGDTYFALDENQFSDTFRIEEANFAVERRGLKQIFIKMNKNTTNSERKITVRLQDCTFFTSISIIQFSDTTL